MSDTTFRKPVEAVETAPTPEPQKDAPANSVVQVPELVATYMDDQGKPYVAKYFDVESIADEPQFKRDLSEIEGFVQDRVKKGKLDNSTKAASDYLKELERKAGLSRYESTNKRISTLLEYIDFVKKVES